MSVAETIADAEKFPRLRKAIETLGLAAFTDASIANRYSRQNRSFGAVL